MVRRMLARGMLVAITATAIALFSAQQASAQALIYVGGGGSFPTSDFGNYAETGWMAFAGGMIAVGPEGLKVGAEVFYGQNKHKEVEIGPVPFSSEDKTSPYGAMAIASYGFTTGGKLTPYLFGGAGVLVHRFSSPDEESASDSQFGYQGGAGVDFAVSPTIGIFVEGRYMGSKDTQFFGAAGGLAFALGGS